MAARFRDGSRHQLARLPECGIPAPMRPQGPIWTLVFAASLAAAAITGCAGQVTTSDRSEVSESELTSMAAKIRALKSAVANANVPANNDYGKSFAVSEYP